MYNYAFLDEKNICHTIYQSSKERTDIDFDNYVLVPEYDINYVNSRWIPDTNEWEFPPTPDHIYKDGQWIHINENFLQLKTKVRMIQKLYEYLDTNYPDTQDHTDQRQILTDSYGLIFPVVLDDNLPIETLQNCLNHYNIE